MRFSPKNKHQQNRITYFSMPNGQNNKQKIKTQPVDSTQFFTKINFKPESRLHLKTTNYVNKNKSSHQVFMRKHKTNQRHNKYPSELVISQTNLTQRTQHQTQRQQFIKELNSRVILSENSSVLQEQNQKYLKQQTKKGRYEKQFSNSKLERSAVRSKGSLGEFTNRDMMERPGRQSSDISVIRIKSVNGQFNQDYIELRDRAKTFAKDFSKIIQDNLNFRQKTYNSDEGKTIQENNIEQLIQISQSNATNQIIAKKTAQPHPNIPRNQLNKSQIIQANLDNHSASGETNRVSSLDIKNTQKYEEQVEQLTKEFLSDWDKMNKTKTNLYEKFRNKIVKQFPTLRKKYKQSELQPPQMYQRSKKTSSALITPGLQSSIKISFNNQNANSEMNYLTVTQLRQEAQRMERNEDRWKQQQKKTLKEIFKQAYFYSKTRNKCFNTNYEKTDEQLQQQRRIRYIQKNMTFMKYINKKDSKINVSNAKKIRGDNILRNKDSILQLEKEGSLKQQYLLKCLENAIEDCFVNKR